MAFFSSQHAYDSQLRRKRSTSTTRDRISRPSMDDKSADETSLRKRSPSISASPSSAVTPEPQEPAPPLPTPVSAGISRSRTTVSSDTPDVPSSYDQSSTPIPFTKPTKRASPPLFTNLMIDVPGPDQVDQAQPIPSPQATTRQPVKRSNSNRTVASSSSASHYVPSSSSANDAQVRPEIRTLDRYPPPALNHDISGSVLHSVTADVEHQRSLPSQPITPASSVKSPTRKRNSETGPISLPTPVSPSKEHILARPEQSLIPLASVPMRAHSRSHSATTSPIAHPSGPVSTKSSIKRVPVPLYDQEGAVVASGPGSFSGSGKSTPTHDASAMKPREKRTRNVLRKPSVTRHREAASAPTSDSEKKTKSHRPRARSVVFSSSSRRNSSGTVFDLAQPLPAKSVTGVDLTPAGEILVAYKESQRGDFARDSSFRSSGKLVAVGSPEDNAVTSLRSPWAAGWRTVRLNDEGSADERDAGEKRGTGLRRSLSRKLSGKWGAKEPERRRDDYARRSASGSALEFSERRLPRDVEAKRSATFPNDKQASASPTSGGSRQQSGWPNDDEEGRVWEEDVGDWVGKHLRDREEETDVSNPRRLWKLVKRFSSGNLKEKHSPPLEALPPVPPLPKDLTRRQPERSTEEAEDIDAGEMPLPHSAVPETPGGIMRYITSVPSLSIPRSKSISGAKQTSPQRQPDPGLGASPPAPSRTSARDRSGTTGTTPQVRRSTTTRSSSPSSENTKFFSRSRTSSSSSYGDELAPPMPSMPIAHVGKHIVPPRELYGILNDKGEGNAGRRHSISKTNAPVSAPTSSEGSPTGSANIPSFEAHNPINKFSPYKGKRSAISPLPPTSHFPDSEPVPLRNEQPKRVKPPPIPQRNPRRPSHNSASVPSLPLPVRQNSLPAVIAVQDSSESEATDGDASRARRRPDLGQTPTAPKARPRSISDGAIIPEPEQYPSTAKSTLTFREMTSTQRHLTEQEKNAKWEDLLQRSDQAGGTLHVGSPTMGGLGLWSDRSSMALSEILDRY